MVECLPYTEKVAGSNPASSTGYSYDLGMAEALRKIGMFKGAVSQKWMLDRMSSGIAHRQAARGIEGGSAQQIARSLEPHVSSTARPDRMQMVQQAKKEFNVGGRSEPFGGTAAAKQPPAPRPADYQPKVDLSKPKPKGMMSGSKTPYMLAGGGIGLGAMMANSGNNTPQYNPYG